MHASYRFGRCELNPATRQVLVDGAPAALGGRAFDVLLALVVRSERLVTKDELLEIAWPAWSSRKTISRSRSAVAQFSPRR